MYRSMSTPATTSHHENTNEFNLLGENTLSASDPVIYDTTDSQDSCDDIKSKTDKYYEVNDQIYNRFNKISNSVKLVINNLDKGDNEIIFRAMANMFTIAAAGAINYGLGIFVPAITAAPSLLQGITGTIAGDVVNTVLQKTLCSDLTHTLDASNNKLPRPTNTFRNVVKKVMAEANDRKEDYAFAIATGNSFPLAYTNARDGTQNKNFVTKNINSATNMIYYRGLLAQQAYHNIKLLLKEIDGLEEVAKGLHLDLVSAIARSNDCSLKQRKSRLFSKRREFIDIAKKAHETRDLLLSFKEDAQRLGYPAAYLSKYWHQTGSGNNSYSDINTNNSNSSDGYDREHSSISQSSITPEENVDDELSIQDDVITTEQTFAPGELAKRNREIRENWFKS